MIQRIQSLWLLISAISSVALLIFPFGEITFSEGIQPLGVFNIFAANDVKALDYICWFIGIMGISSAVWSLLAIFNFKNRIKQLRLVRNTVFYQVFQILGLISLFYFFGEKMGLTQNPLVVLPVIGIVFNLLAIKDIRKDDELVKSIDRIR